MQRVVEQTTLPGGVWISTVPLASITSSGDGPPLIFETMVWSPPTTAPTSTWIGTHQEQAEGHRRMVTKTGWTPW